MLYEQTVIWSCNSCGFLIKGLGEIRTVWQSARNKDCSLREASYRDGCLEFGETATLAMRLEGNKRRKTDLQPLFFYRPCKCSLLEREGKKDVSHSQDLPHCSGIYEQP